MFACRFDPIRHTRNSSVAASNHNIVKEERNGDYKSESGKNDWWIRKATQTADEWDH